MFGFSSYDELKEYVLVFFSGIKYHTPKDIIENGKLKVEPCSPTDFEQIILVKHFLHACPHGGKVGLMYSLHRTTILKYLNKWAPRWGKYGEHLSILPLPHDYFKRELPDKINDIGLGTCAFMFDGKDTLSETIRKDDPMR